MTGALSRLRSELTAQLNRAGIPALAAYEPERQVRRTEPVAAVSLAKVVCAPGGFRDYLGRRTAADGTEEELYGRAAELTLALDIYAPRDGGESAAREIMERLAEELAVPCAVKIVNGGSSIGVELPDTREQLEKALRGLLRYGGHVVVEKKIKGREIQIAVLGDTYLPAVEIIPRGAYFDYVSKYQKDGAEEICPAPITEAEWRQIGEMALTLHRGLGLSVYSRSDFILDEDGNAWCLEVNTLPGMTPTSLVPQEAAQVGLSYADLCERIVTDSLALRKAAHL